MFLSIAADGDRAVALEQLASRVTSTNRLIESDFAIAFTVREGAIVSYLLLEDSFAVAEAAQSGGCDPNL